jgi:RIO-like serine/threonine protein kinase
VNTIKTDHANAAELLERDIKNVLIFFSRKFKIELTAKEVFEYVTGEVRSLVF